VAYAADVHARQRRKGSPIPYVSHLLAVSAIVLEHGGTEVEAIAALLHDAPEDHGGQPRLDDIRLRFGDAVGDIVEACSDSLAEDPSQKAAWKVRKIAYHEHLRDASTPSARLVSAADKLHNARSTAADLRREGPSVWSRFKAGPEETLWNYDELIKVYDTFGDDGRLHDLVNELRLVVDAMRKHSGAAAG
jgi:(p)ppGpp synthase/HD superfamily hydrolase